MSIMTKMAMEIYRPPFRFERGHFYDSENNMVADKHEELRIRGWGRISYMPEPEALQDHIGELIAQAMTEFWKNNPKTNKAEGSE